MLLRRYKRFLPWILILLIGLFLRLRVLTGVGTLWNDEAFSRHFALLPLGRLLGLMTLDVHPPLHAALLHFWMRLFGDGVLAVRLMSLVASVAGLAVFARLARRLYAKKDAMLALFLAAFSPLMVYYGADGRMYALVFLLSALSAWWFWRMTDPPSPDGYGGARGEARVVEAWMWVSMALAMTHLTGALVIAAQGLFLLRRPECRPLFRKLLPRFLLIALVFSLWLVPAAKFRLEHIDREWQFRSGQEDTPAWLSLTYWFWLGAKRSTQALVGVALAAFAFAAVLRRSERKPHLNLTPQGEFLLWWLALTTVPFAFFPNVTPRYLIAAVIPLFLLVAHGFLNVARGSRAGLLLGAMLAILAFYPGLTVQLATRPYGWDVVYDWIAERKRPLGDPLVFGWYADRLAFEATAAPPFDRDLSIFGYSGRPEMNIHGLYPFDDEFDTDERYAAHAGTLAIGKEDFERLAPVVDATDRLFFIPNAYVTLREGGKAIEAQAEWFAARGFRVKEALEPDGRTPGAWLMVKE